MNAVLNVLFVLHYEQHKFLKKKFVVTSVKVIQLNRNQISFHKQPLEKKKLHWLSLYSHSSYDRVQKASLGLITVPAE